jgi:hypothetical protein
MGPLTGFWAPGRLDEAMRLRQRPTYRLRVVIGARGHRQHRNSTHDYRRRKHMAKKYSDAASAKVRKVMHERKEGTLNSTSSRLNV